MSGAKLDTSLHESAAALQECSVSERTLPAIRFAQTFFKTPKMLGSVVPSSRFLISEIVRRVDWPNAKTIVEFGPGTGVITEQLLTHARADAKVIAVELNDNLADLLRARLKDPRLQIVRGSATEIDRILLRLGIGEVDQIIAGIPFSIMKPHDRLQVLQKSHDVLRRGGSLLIYQFSRRVRRDLKRVFGEVDSSFEPLNFLPAHLFQCRRK